MENVKKVHTKDMEEDYLHGKMAKNIQDIGLMIKEKVMEKIVMLMEIFMKEIIKMEKKKEKEIINGKMGMSMRENGKMI